jgi:hypothetical protein
LRHQITHPKQQVLHGRGTSLELDQQGEDTRASKLEKEKMRSSNHLGFNPNQILTTSRDPDQLEFPSNGILAD